MTALYQLIKHWTEADLQNLPAQENDQYEYKGGATKRDDLRKKLGKAASAFWNAGGGVFIVGIDGDGKIDGGLPKTLVGKQSLRDWIDQALAEVQPPGPYDIRLIESTDSVSAIKPDHTMLVIGFGPSPQAPHMAPDHIYYIRLGALSMPASHMIVEALRAHRAAQQPQLRCILRANKKTPRLLEVAIVATNTAPALDVCITFDPIPESVTLLKHHHPIHIPVINSENPYSLIVGSIMLTSNGPRISENNFHIQLTYANALGNSFAESYHLNTQKNFFPEYVIIEPEAEKVVKAIGALTKAVEEIKKKLK